MVRALGINLSRLRLFVFALGVGLAAIAGVVMAPIWGIRPHVGVDAVVPAFLIIVLGGVGSFWGAVIAGAAGRAGGRPDRRLRVRVVAAVDVPAVHRRRHVPLARPVRQEERARHMNDRALHGQGRAGHRRRRHDGPGGGARAARRRLPRRAGRHRPARAMRPLESELGATRRARSPATSATPTRCARRTRAIVAALGAVDILVNNAGILSNNKLEATDVAEWRRVLARQPRRRASSGRRRSCRR